MRSEDGGVMSRLGRGQYASHGEPELVGNPWLGDHLLAQKRGSTVSPLQAQQIHRVWNMQKAGPKFQLAGHKGASGDTA